MLLYSDKTEYHRIPISLKYFVEPVSKDFFLLKASAGNETSFGVQSKRWKTTEENIPKMLV